MATHERWCILLGSRVFQFENSIRQNERRASKYNKKKQKSPMVSVMLPHVMNKTIYKNGFSIIRDLHIVSLGGIGLIDHRLDLTR